METIGNTKITEAQLRTIEWLVGSAQKDFANNDFAKDNKLFQWEVEEGFKDVALSLRSEARENTGMLFMSDDQRIIWIGKRGGINKASWTSNNLVSNHKATRAAKMGIVFVL